MRSQIARDGMDITDRYLRQEVQADASAAEAAAWLSDPFDSPWRAPGWRELIEQWTNEPEWKDANDQL